MEGHLVTRTLPKNNIITFLLRIDFSHACDLPIEKVAEEMSRFFVRAEKRRIENFTIETTGNESMVKKKDSYDHVLVSESPAFAMVFSEVQNSIWIESTQYLDNSLYKSSISKLIDILSSSFHDISSRRIGMRYVNNFECKRISDITKIFNKRVATVIKNMLDSESLSRVIGVEEYKRDSNNVRIQYGVPNKFYPEKITSFDLLFDIDSYIESINEIDEWHEIIETLNHEAYSCFVSTMNEKYLETLK